MIIFRDILANMEIYIKCSTTTVDYGSWPYDICNTPMVSLNDYDFGPPNERNGRV